MTISACPARNAFPWSERSRADRPSCYQAASRCTPSRRTRTRSPKTPPPLRSSRAWTTGNRQVQPAGKLLLHRAAGRGKCVTQILSRLLLTGRRRVRAPKTLDPRCGGCSCLSGEVQGIARFAPDHLRVARQIEVGPTGFHAANPNQRRKTRHTLQPEKHAPTSQLFSPTRPTLNLFRPR